MIVCQICGKEFVYYNGSNIFPECLVKTERGLGCVSESLQVYLYPLVLDILNYQDTAPPRNFI